MNSAAFFAVVRPLFGSLSQAQVDGLDFLIVNAPAELPVTFKAYVLATVFRETGGTMQPIYENGPKSYFDKYEPGTPKGKRLGNVKKGDGYLFRGRGYVQITGRRNYTFAGDKLNLDLVKDPDLALRPDVAARILYRGMIDGWFTGVGLGRFLDGKTDYRNARKVVNGLDKADKIAGYALIFEKALREAAKEAPPPAPPAPVTTEPPPVPPATAAPVGFWAWFKSLFA